MRANTNSTNNEESQFYLKSLCEEAIYLFMNGKNNELAQKISEVSKIKHAVEQCNSGLPKKQIKNKYEYELDFEEEDEPQKSKKTSRKPKPRMQAQRKSEYCKFCPDNEELHLISASNYVYLGLPKLKTFRKHHHLILAPVQHISTRIGADESMIEQIRNYQKCLIQMMDKLGLHAIFIEQFCQNNSHIYIECLGIPLKKAYDMPFFFKQALENVEGFWTTHKQIIQIRKEKGGIDKQIPRQIKYFYIDFGLGYGYAHVIEDEKYWNRNFCYEIVAAALGMQSYEVKTTEEYEEEQLELKSKQFNKVWKPFDWTVLIDAAEQK